MDPHLKDLGVKVGYTSYRRAHPPANVTSIFQVKHMHLVSSFEGFALYRHSLRLRGQLSETRDPSQYRTLHEKIFRLLIFAKEKLELATFSIPVSYTPDHLAC